MWLRNPRHRLARAVLAAVALALLGACGESTADPGAPASELERSPEPPFDLSSGFRVAGRGDDLVVLQYATDAAAIRWTADGTWSTLPSFDDEGYFEFVTIGPTVVAGGFTCSNSFSADGYCTDGEVALFRLSEDLTEWTRLEVPDIPVTSEPELTASTGPQAVGEFQIQGTDVSVDAEGRVTIGDVTSYDGTGFACLVDGTFVNVATRGTDPAVQDPMPGAQVVARIATRPVDEPDAGWSLIDVGAEVIPVADLGRICGVGRVSLIPEGGTSEWVVDVAGRTIRSVESNTAAVVGSTWAMRPGEQAESPDGRTLYVAREDGEIVRRTDLAPWESAGAQGERVWASDAGVWTFDRTSGDFVRLDPPA